MNVKLRYLYRDAGNYKNYGETIFSNKARLALPAIDAALRECMIDKGWFVANRWGLPDLHFKEFEPDSELDHDWHEYAGLELTAEPVSRDEDIADFLKRVQSLAK